ncbi:MAG: MFS transporter [Pseudomonadota bacterium]
MRLPTHRLSLFVTSGLVIGGISLPITMLLPTFYAETVGIDLTLVGTIFMLTRFWDVFTDPLMGVISDRFPSRFGRRRHWLVFSIPIIVGALLALCFPPAGAGPAYLAFCLFIFYIGFTLASISMFAWAAEVSTDYHERSRIMAFLQAANGLGTLALLVSIAYLDMNGAPLDRKVATVGLLLACAAPVAFFVSVLSVSEPPAQRRKPQTSTNWLNVLRSNKALQLLLGADLLFGLVQGLFFGLVIFYASDVLKLPQASGIFMLLMLAVGVPAIVLWARLSKRYGKHKVLAYASLTGAAMTFFLGVAPAGNMAFGAVAFGLQGFGLGAALYLTKSIMADVADEDRLLSGEDRTGLMYAFLTLTYKVGLAFALGLSFPILDAFGFRPGEENAGSAILSLRALMVFGPAACFLGAAFLLWRFPIDEAQQKKLRTLIADEPAFAGKTKQ